VLDASILIKESAVDNSPVVVKVNIYPPEPVTKLIETAGPHLAIRNETRKTDKRSPSEKEFNKTFTQAKADAAKDQIDVYIREILVTAGVNLLELTLPPIYRRANARLKHTELRRQRNIEAIVSEAAKRLVGRAVCKEKVSEDWIATFFDSCKDVSDEKMQLLWAKVLTGEIIQSRSFSQKTLQTIRILDSHESEVIQILSTFLITINNHPYLLDPEIYQDIHSKEHKGLVANYLYLDIFEPKICLYVKYGTSISYFNTTIHVVTEFPLHCYRSTIVGKQLFSLYETRPDKAFSDSLNQIFKNRGK
jgi:hypothetical protein